MGDKKIPWLTILGLIFGVGTTVVKTIQTNEAIEKKVNQKVDQQVAAGFQQLLLAMNQQAQKSQAAGEENKE